MRASTWTSCALPSFAEGIGWQGVLRSCVMVDRADMADIGFAANAEVTIYTMLPT